MSARFCLAIFRPARRSLPMRVRTSITSRATPLPPNCTRRNDGRGPGQSEPPRAHRENLFRIRCFDGCRKCLRPDRRPANSGRLIPCNSFLP